MKTLNLCLLLLLCAAIAATWWLKYNPLERNTEFIPGMFFSIPYDAQTTNPVFSDRKTLQAMPVGTLARNAQPIHYLATPQDALLAGSQLTNPIPASDATAFARGNTVYTNFCAVCHGGAGTGDGSVTKYGFPPPPSLLAQHGVAMADGQMFHLLTFGQGNMPSYASQIDESDRWKVILYIRSLQKSTAPTENRAP